MEMKKDNRKTVLAVGIICLFLAIAGAAALFTFAERREDGRRAAIDFTQEVKVENGTANPGAGEWELPIVQAGLYRFSAGWQVPDTPFITGCVIRDGEGHPVFAVTGGSLSADSTAMKLDAGTYKVEMHYLANEEDYRNFVRDFIGNAGEEEAVTTESLWPDTAGKDGVWSVDYTVEARGASNWYALGVGAGIVIGLLLVVILVAWTKRGKSVKNQFDERQELVRGRGAKYGFFTLLLCNMAVFMLEAAEIPEFADTEVLMVVNCLIGICVYAVYCIWHDGYFALNENRGRLMTTFAVITIFNFVVSAAGIAHGRMIQDGRLTFRSVNLFCGIAFLVIFFAIFLKKIRGDR